MIGNKIRLLEASEIECRVGSIGKNGLSLLLYKDARVDQKILDECFSPCGWKRTISAWLWMISGVISK